MKSFNEGQFNLPWVGDCSRWWLRRRPAAGGRPRSQPLLERREFQWRRFQQWNLYNWMMSPRATIMGHPRWCFRSGRDDRSEFTEFAWTFDVTSLRLAWDGIRRWVVVEVRWRSMNLSTKLNSLNYGRGLLVFNEEICYRFIYFLIIPRSPAFFGNISHFTK